MSLLKEGNKQIKYLCIEYKIPIKCRLTGQILYSRTYDTTQYEADLLRQCCINLACKIMEIPTNENLIFGTTKLNYKQIKEAEKYICIKINYSFNIIPIHFIYLKLSKLLNNKKHIFSLKLLDEIHEDERILKIKYFDHEKQPFGSGDVAVALFNDEDIKYLVGKMGLFHNFDGIDEIRYEMFHE